jgi:hypothetical protein
MIPSPALRPVALALLGVLLLGAAGCEGEPVSPEVQARRDRGRDEAIFREFKNASDCGSLVDKEEERGCAAYVNSLDD